MRRLFSRPPGLRNQLFILVLLVLVPALGLAVYAGFRQRRAAVEESRERQVWCAFRLRGAGWNTAVLQPDISRDSDRDIPPGCIWPRATHNPVLLTLVPSYSARFRLGLRPPKSTWPTGMVHAVKTKSFSSTILISRSAGKASRPAFRSGDQGRVVLSSGRPSIWNTTPASRQDNLPKLADVASGGFGLYRTFPAGMLEPLPDLARALDKTAWRNVTVGWWGDRIYDQSLFPTMICGGQPRECGLPAASPASAALCSSICGLGAGFGRPPGFCTGYLPPVGPDQRPGGQGGDAAADGLGIPGEIGALPGFRRAGRALAARTEGTRPTRMEGNCLCRTLLEAAPIP
jgi:hypothetical protein